ncbi:carbohydrate kinase family protein [Phenylobacterium sp.]|jgi:sugar/nucleoside kinase (ribokinase family)|uniref:carbohydrate kinase family protein n=1 Tax=Phenylobacterium sp. TaxID=1871053 RepID=UPI002F3F9487
MALDLLCIGLTTLDVVARPIDRLPDKEETILIDGIEVVPAGTAAGAALVAGALGLDVGLAGAVGDDRNGRFVRLVLGETGVRTDWLQTIPEAPTSTTVLAIDANGRRPAFHALGASHRFALSPPVFEAAAAARFVHWAGVGARNLDRGPGAELLAAAKAGGAVVTCDLISPNRHAAEELSRLLPYVDWFLPSATEALALSGAADLPAAAAHFRAQGAGACIIKNGADGAFFSLGERQLTLPAHAISPVDTTSCGDAWCAGFIAGLRHGFDPVEAARFATATAALVAQGLGTLGRLQDFDTTLQAMRTLPLREPALA